jgi:hypothetical protein
MSLRAEIAHHPSALRFNFPKAAQLILDCPFAPYHDRQAEGGRQKVL